MEDIQVLSRLYDEQIQSAQNLLNLLEEEEDALKTRNIDGINVCAKDKQSLLEDFENKATKRQNLYQRINADHQTKLHPARPDIENKQDKLKRLLESVQRQNRINAAILSVSRDFTLQMLDIIRGNPSQQATYDALGQSSNGSKNQSLAKV